MSLLLICWAVLTVAMWKEASGSISDLNPNNNNLYIIGKNRPANVSSKFTSNTNAALANDGNTNGVMLHGVRCFHTAQYDLLPWWMLDMLEVLPVFGARVWNRLNGPTSVRFTQISLGITSNPSVWTAFNKDLFDLCMYYGGVPTPAENPINFTCARPIAGRYLTVYKNGIGTAGEARGETYLHFCEIDVLAIRKNSSSHTRTTTPSFFPTSTSLIDSQSAGRTNSKIECLGRCLEHSYCLYVLASPTSSEHYDCWLFESFNIPTNFTVILNWNVGAKFFSLY